MTNHKKFVLVLILVYSLVSVLANDNDKCTPRCVNRSSCVKRGSVLDTGEAKNKTTEYYCLCQALYYGEDCSGKWNDDSDWRAAFIFYGIYSVILMLICAVFSGWQLVITYCYGTKTSWNKWTIVTSTLLLVFVGCTIRVIAFAIDPHAVREIFPAVLSYILYTLPILLWLAAGYGLVLYWLELHLQSGIREVVFVSRLRPALYTMIGVSAVLIIPVAIANAVINTYIGLVIYNVACFISFLAIIILSLVYGIKLRNTIENVWKKTKVQVYKSFLLKITWFLYTINIFLVLSIITLVVYTIIGESDRWQYFILNMFLRAEEFGVIMPVLLLLAKKVPKKDSFESSGHSKEVTLSMMTPTRSISTEPLHLSGNKCLNRKTQLYNRIISIK